ncbi:MAG: ABC transporter permease [Dehalococcoidales bacterium]|nr:ABC transporter permease [Dehalococcoidales bacterium]
MPPIIQGILNTSISEGLVYAFIAIGVFLTLRVLAFPDLTVDGSFVVGGSIVAVMIAGGYNPFLATIVAFVGGLACGAITGLLNTKLRIPALLAGILMMVGLYSVNLLIMGRPNIPLLRSVTMFDSIASWFGMARSTILVIIVFAVIAFIVFMLLNWFLRTEIGLALRASGDNEQMVRSLGVDTDKNILLGVAISNGLVALAGALVAQNQQFSDVNMGIGMIVMGLAAVIIGEALIHPRGVTSMLLAAFVGTFLYRLFITIAFRLGLAPGNLKLITALLVIIAMAIPYIQKKLRHEWMPPAARW